MATKLLIPRVLQRYCDGRGEVRLPGDTVRALLVSLRAEFPSLYQCVCDETGAVRQHINLFLNNDLLAKRDGLDAPVGERDIVSVYQAVSGG